MTTTDTPSFNCHRNQGFQIRFGNGYTVSVQFGAFHYCSNRDMTEGTCYDAWRKGQDVHVCPDAEVAIIDPNGQFVQFESGDSVRGRTDPDTVGKIIAWVMQQGNTDAT